MTHLDQSHDPPATATEEISSETPVFGTDEVEAGGVREMELEFRGDQSEYFRIWIVNLCLTLLTCGIFSAWAKVRKKRYFFSNLFLDGTPFQYQAKPIPILKGRIIAAVLFGVYYVSINYVTALLPYILAAALAVAPWIIVRSQAFNARYTVYRNLSFRFEGSYFTALKVILTWGIVPIFAVGVAFQWWGLMWLPGVVALFLGAVFPLWLRNLKNYSVTNTAYGGLNGVFGATGGDFWSIHWVGGWIAAAISIPALLVVGFGTAFSESVPGMRELMIGVFLVVTYFAYLVAFSYIRANLTNAVWNKLTVGPVSFTSTMKTSELFKLYFTNALGIIFTAGLLTPWAVMRTFKYRADQLNAYIGGDFREFHGTQTGAVHAAGDAMGDFFDVDISI